MIVEVPTPPPGALKLSSELYVIPLSSGTKSLVYPIGEPAEGVQRPWESLLSSHLEDDYHPQPDRKPDSSINPSMLSVSSGDNFTRPLAEVVSSG